MKFPVRLILFVFSFLFTSIYIMAQDVIEQKGYISNPYLSNHGIIYTDNFGSSISIEKEGVTRELLTSPGCGNFYSVSPDENFIGTKIIDANGLQTPAIINITTGEIKKLSESSSLCGQVSFTADGRYAFTVNKELFVSNGYEFEKYNLGFYANLAPISPDGKCVVFNDNNDQLWLYDLSVKSKKIITDNLRGYMHPVWSFDGQMLIYSSLDGIIHVFDMNKSVSYTIGQGFNPTWSNKSHDHIVFYKKEINDLKLINSDIYIADYDGSNLSRLTSTLDIMEMDPHFSKDDSQIIYHTFDKTEMRIADIIIGQNNSVKCTVKNILPVSVSVKHPELFTSLRKITTLDMPYVHQAYDTPDYFNGSSACGAATAIMVIAYYNLLPEWDILCTYHKPDHITHWGRYICDEYLFREYDFYLSAKAGSTNGQGGYGFMWNSGSPYSTIADYYTKHGIISARSDAPEFSFVTSEINAGYPYTLCVALTSAGHIVAAHGMGVKDHSLIFNDPWGNKNSGSYPSENGKNVTYDWPGYNNGNQNLQTIWWGVTCRASLPSKADTLVDDLQFRNGFYMNTKAPASMTKWKDKNKGYNGHFWYAYTNVSDSADICYAEWHPNLSKAGKYEVSAYIPFASATNARYRIFHKDGSSVVSINQKPLVNSWVSLGSYEFDQGNSGYVRLGDGSSVKGEAVVFDAVKFSFLDSQIAGVTGKSLPVEYRLGQNYPNPFNPSTKISFYIPANSFVTLKVYDLLGNEIETLVNSELQKGSYDVQFPSKETRIQLQSGTYFYSLRAGSYSETKKMIFLK